MTIDRQEVKTTGQSIVNHVRFVPDDPLVGVPPPLILCGIMSAPGNPAFLIELVLFLTMLLIGFLLVFAGRNSNPLSMFEWGFLLFGAGLIPTTTSLIAPLLRNRTEIDEELGRLQGMHWFIRIWYFKEQIAYLLFLGTGVVLMGADWENRECEEARHWKSVFGATFLEAGFVYFLIRAFLWNEAPEDKIRSIEEELERTKKELQAVRESMAKGLASSYFLNFVKWVCIGLFENGLKPPAGMVPFQSDEVDQNGKFVRDSAGNVVTRVDDVNVDKIVIVVPLLSRDDFVDNTSNKLFMNYTDSITDGITNANNNQLTFKKGGIAEEDFKRPGSFTRKQQVLMVENGHGRVFVDVPTTLLTLWNNVMQNYRSSSPEERWAAYKEETARFSSRLIRDFGCCKWNLKQAAVSVPVPFSSTAVVIEYDGTNGDFYDTFMEVLDTTQNLSGTTYNSVVPPRSIVL